MKKAVKMDKLYLSKYNHKIQNKEKEEIILFNSLTGAIDVIDRQLFIGLKEIKKKNETKIFDSETINELINRGYLYQGKKDEEEKIKESFLKFKKEKIDQLHRVCLAITYDCNLACSYCFQSEINSKSSLIKPNVVKKMFEAIARINEKSTCKNEPVIVLFGGEPLINKPKQKEIITEILKECKNRNYNSGILTNGVELINYFDIISKYGISRVEPTLDGPQEIHDKRRIYQNGNGTFNIIKNGIDQYLEHGINITVRTNVDKDNIEYLPKLANFYIEKGWTKKKEFYNHITPVRECNRKILNMLGYETKILKSLLDEKTFFERIIELQKKHPEMKVLETSSVWSGAWSLIYSLDKKQAYKPSFKICGGNPFEYCLDLNGDMYFCPTTCGIQELSMGKFYPELKLDDNKIKKWNNVNIFSSKKCNKCNWNLLCGGGCSALTYIDKDSQKICPDYKNILQKVFEYKISK
jgi:uncharacterized protein